MKGYILYNKQACLHVVWMLGLLWFCSGCTSRTEEASLVLVNGNIYTLDPKQPRVEAVAVRDGEIVWTGTSAQAQTWMGTRTQVLDLGGRTVVPGLTDAHAHLMGIGQGARILDLSSVTSYEELIRLVQAAAVRVPRGTWIVGRGWHQSKFQPQPIPVVQGYPIHGALSAAVPYHPVMLTHASGHAILANALAMEEAGIQADTQVGTDGEIIRHPDGRPTGIFTENAASLIEKVIPADGGGQFEADLEAATAHCLRNGITSLHDAGASGEVIRLYQQRSDPGLRLYVMLNGSDTALVQQWYRHGPEIGPYLTVRAVKYYGDGALGSRGAWLLAEYSDRHGHAGNPLMDTTALHQAAVDAIAHDFQMCTHAIGDRSNREVLDAYEKALAAYPDKAPQARFRIEHAQHIDPQDIPRFAGLGVIASMQAIHMSSDRPWAIDRLGPERINSGAYRWQTLLRSGAVIANGTDAPVEPVNPIANFYAAVTRQTLAGVPSGGYEPAEKMTREQALRSLTLDAAYAAFQETVSGSIVPGKYADFTVLSQDLMTVPDSAILNTQVVMTIVGGKVRYRQEP
ncbi:MAG: amidohydrolase [Bacteroidia bacterium]|nr:amidohydrolase [Bacteroidia bacterium]